MVNFKAFARCFFIEDFQNILHFVDNVGTNTHTQTFLLASIFLGHPWPTMFLFPCFLTVKVRNQQGNKKFPLHLFWFFFFFPSYLSKFYFLLPARKKKVFLRKISCVMLSSEILYSQILIVLPNKQRREDNLLWTYMGESSFKNIYIYILESTKANKHFEKNIAICFDDRSSRTKTLGKTESWECERIFFISSGLDLTPSLSCPFQMLSHF